MGRASVAGAAFLLGCTVQGGAPSSVDVPRALAGYRSWKAVVKDARPVPFEMWTRCVAATPADWERAREKHGPHTQRFIRVYANPPAAEGLAGSARATVPVGAVIVKEKLMAEADAAPAGVAFMVKRAQAKFRESGGWEFLHFPAGPDRRRTHEACAACHRASSSDYVFGDY